MPATNVNRYNLLRNQILANAYLIYPNKSTKRKTPARTSRSREDGIEEQQPSHGSSGSTNRSSRTHDTHGSQPSSLVDVEVRQTDRRDLEVAICRHHETLALSSPQDVFYAVVFDKNECSGFAPEEQQAQITRQRHKLRGHVLTTKPEDACGSEEDALIRLCERLEREASAVVMGTAVITRLDRKVHHSDTYGQRFKSSGDHRVQQRDSFVEQYAPPAGGHASFNESQVETEEDTESQQQRLLAQVRDESFHEESPPAFETMRSHTTRPMQAFKPEGGREPVSVTTEEYCTQPTQAVQPGNEGPYRHRLRRY